MTSQQNGNQKENRRWAVQSWFYSYLSALHLEDVYLLLFAIGSVHLQPVGRRSNSFKSGWSELVKSLPSSLHRKLLGAN